VPKAGRRIWLFERGDPLHFRHRDIEPASFVV